MLGFSRELIDPTSQLPRHRFINIYGSNSSLLYAPEAELAAIKGKRALITGSNTGVGYETALALARAGCHVVLACRSMPKANAAVESIRSRCAAETVVEAWTLDLLSLESVRALAKRWADQGHALDLLICNAGAIWLDRKQSDDGFEYTYQTNCLSHFLLTILLLPYLAKSPAPRVVNVTSAACHDGIYDLDNVNLEKTPPHWNIIMRYVYGGKAYANSKLYQVLSMVALQDRLNRSSDAGQQRIVLLAAHPGMVASDIAGKDSYGLPNWVLAIAAWGLRHIARTSAQGAQTSIYVATASITGGEKYKGSFWADCHQFAMPASCYDEAKKDAFWKRICRDAGVSVDCV